MTIALVLLASSLTGTEALPPIRDSLYVQQVQVPGSTIYEVIPTQEGLGFSVAIVDLQETRAHYHQNMAENYTVLSGTIELRINNDRMILQAGDSYLVPAGAIHAAKSCHETPARVLVSGVPGWTFQDHIFVE